MLARPAALPEDAQALFGWVRTVDLEFITAGETFGLPEVLRRHPEGADIALSKFTDADQALRPSRDAQAT